MGALVKIWYLLLFVLIVGIFLWGNVYHLIVEERLSLHNYYSNPEKYGGYKRQNFGKVINISRDSFYFDTSARDRRLELAFAGLYQFTLSFRLLAFQFTFGTLPSEFRDPVALPDFIQFTENL